jgi:hypothetical protein
MTYAIAVDVRQALTHARLGIALVVPSRRYVTYLSDSRGAATVPSPSETEWREIDAWHQEAEEGLPLEPRQIGTPLIGALTGSPLKDGCVGRRFAAVPVDAVAADELAAELRHMLPGLLKSRREA